jgi:hypothetical protein
MNVTKQPHAPANLPPGGVLPIPMWYETAWPQDLVWMFWTEKYFDRAGIRTRNRPAFNLDAVLTALSIYFKYSNYVSFSFVCADHRYSENHVYLAFSNPELFNRCIRNHNACTKLPLTNQNLIHEEVNSALHVAELATFQFIRVPSSYLNTITINNFPVCFS